MKNKVLSEFSDLEKQRKEILNLYGGLSSHQLLFKPDPSHWNLLQVLRHLVTAEVQSVVLIRRRLSHHERSKKAGLSASIRHMILKIALVLPIKFKAPKIAEVHDEAPDIETMKSEWVEVRNDINTIINETDSDVLAKELYIHPRAGALNIKQALEFINTHTSHHQKQMERIMNHSDFPA